MSLRFFKRIRLLPGVSLNLSKSGPSLSFGGRGLRHTIGPRGSRTTLGLPGTGLSYSFTGNKPADKSGASAKPPARRRKPAAVADTPQDGGADRGAQEFLRAIIAFQGEKPAEALRLLQLCPGSADADWLSGMIHLQTGDPAAARRRFEQALARPDQLGVTFAAHQVSVDLDWPLTDELTLAILPEPVTTRLILAETCQELGQIAAALSHLAQCLDEAPGDPAVAVAFAEVALEPGAGSSKALERAASGLTAAKRPGPLHWIVLLMLGRLHNHQGQPDLAILEFMAGQQIRGLARDARHQLQYEMALSFAQTGDRQRCRQELSAIYAQDPGFADIAQRLGARRGA